MKIKSLLTMLVLASSLLLTSCNNNINVSKDFEIIESNSSLSYKVKDILKIASLLDVGEFSKQEYCVEGLVISRPTNTNNQNKFSFIIGDELDSLSGITVLLASSEVEIYKSDKVLVKAFIHRSSENNFELTGQKLDYDKYSSVNISLIAKGEYQDAPKYASSDETITLLDMVSVLFSKNEHYPLSDEFIERYQQNSGGYIELAESVGIEVNRQKHSPNQKWHFFESWLLENLKTDKLKWEDDAKSKVYTRLLCPELLLWIYEALDADPYKVKQAKEIAEQAKVDGTHISTMASNMRKAVPFDELKI